MRRTNHPWLLPALAVLAALSPLQARAGDTVQYNRDIRPILVENCFACHGADSAARKAALRLDQRANAIKMEAIIPGQANQSELVRRIFHDDPKKIMPP